jgi:hypothetical protein
MMSKQGSHKEVGKSTRRWKGGEKEVGRRPQEGEKKDTKRWERGHTEVGRIAQLD